MSFILEYVLFCTNGTLGNTGQGASHGVEQNTLEPGNEYLGWLSYS